jgi:hypothetical protein
LAFRPEIGFRRVGTDGGRKEICRSQEQAKYFSDSRFHQHLFTLERLRNGYGLVNILENPIERLEPNIL